MKIAISYTETTKYVGDSLMAGALKCGHNPVIKPPIESLEQFDVLAFYGMTQEHAILQEKMRSYGKPSIIVDAGYFGRKKEGRGYHKVSVNYLHPQKYFQKVRHKSDRFNRFKLNVTPMRTNGHYIMLAGVGPKSSHFYNMKFQSWDEEAVAIIRKYTDRPIIYRAKPNWAHVYRKLDGTIWSEPHKPLESQLNKIWTVVTHHSNVAVDGILHGVPCFAEDGVPIVIGLSDLSKIESPKIVSYEEQTQFLYDLAYTQWTMEQIANGDCWLHLESEGLLVDPRL